MYNADGIKVMIRIIFYVDKLLNRKAVTNAQLTYRI